MVKMGEAVHEFGGRIMVQLASMGVHDKGRMFINHAKTHLGRITYPVVDA